MSSCQTVLLSSLAKKKAKLLKAILEYNSIRFDGIYLTKNKEAYINYDHIYRDFEWNNQGLLVVAPYIYSDWPTINYKKELNLLPASGDRSLSLPIIDDKSDYLNVPHILLVPDPKVLENSIAISMKELYFLIMHIVNSQTNENHPLLFNFQMVSIQKSYESSKNLEYKLRANLIKYRKDELTKCKKLLPYKGSNDMYLQLKLRNADLMDTVKDERVANECSKSVPELIKFPTKHTFLHKFSLVKYSHTLETSEYEKHELQSNK